MRTQAGARELRFAWSSTARTCSSVTPGNHSTNCDAKAPSSRFSNSAATGTRVPRNTHAPLTRSGSRSTAAQVDQSIIAGMLALWRPPRCLRQRAHCHPARRVICGERAHHFERVNHAERAIQPAAGGLRVGVRADEPFNDFVSGVLAEATDLVIERGQGGGV